MCKQLNYFKGLEKTATDICNAFDVLGGGVMGASGRNAADTVLRDRNKYK